MPPDLDISKKKARHMEKTKAQRDALRDLGFTRRGVPADYRGDDPELCNAPTLTGRPCRARGLMPNGRCAQHQDAGDKPTQGATTRAKGDPSSARMRLKREVDAWIKTRAHLKKGGDGD